MDKIDRVIEMLEEAICEVFSNGVNKVDTKEMYAVADIFKDLNEARKDYYKGEYHKTVTEAMHDSKSLTPEVYKEVAKAQGKMYYSEPSEYDDALAEYHTKRDMPTLEEYFKVISGDMAEILPMMNPSEKELVKRKLQVLMSKVA